MSEKISLDSSDIIYLFYQLNYDIFATYSHK